MQTHAFSWPKSFYKAFEVPLNVGECGFSAHSAFLLNFGNTLFLTRSQTFWIPILPKILEIQNSGKTLKFIKIVSLKSIFGALETLVEYADKTQFSKRPKLASF